MSDFKVDETVEVAEKATQMPQPIRATGCCAWFLQVEDKFESGILKPESMVKTEEHSTVVLFVVELGPDAYSDKTRFPSGPWCRKGDFVLTRAYAGTRLKIHGRELRIINDD